MAEASFLVSQFSVAVEDLCSALAIGRWVIVFADAHTSLSIYTYVRMAELFTVEEGTTGTPDFTVVLVVRQRSSPSTKRKGTRKNICF